MNFKTVMNWAQANQRYLMANLASVRESLKSCIEQKNKNSTTVKMSEEMKQELEASSQGLPAPATLDNVCKAFALSPFERDILLLCAGIELDSTFATLCANANGDPQRPFPTFSMALAALPNPHWSAVASGAPLRYWRLIEVGAGMSLTTSPLRIDERVLHYLTGVFQLDERLTSLVEPIINIDELVASQSILSDKIAGLWKDTPDDKPLPVINLCGSDSATKQSIAVAAFTQVGMNPYIVHAHKIPTEVRELETFLRLLAREVSLTRAALFLDCDELDPGDNLRYHAVTQIIDRAFGFFVVSSRARLVSSQRKAISIDAPKATMIEQKMVWKEALIDNGIQIDGNLDAIVSQFHIPISGIRAACAEARMIEPSDDIASRIWNACRAQARPNMDKLTQRLETAATWNDLVLPQVQVQTLREIVIHIRQRLKVYEQWEFARKNPRGLGISALFVGSSGTGKTMAAEVLANELQLDLFRIDLSQVVNKYIGETEKNLRRVFDAVEAGGGILLFDEADALFGKRSEVKDSHDRYANIEISYLLQRMEEYRGLAILTTNMKDALDTAFSRRIRFIVHFPFPDANLRTQIWRRIFPKNTPVDGIDTYKLARLNITGGNIRNIAMNAAFLAADCNEPIRMYHLLQASRREYSKLEKPLTDAEIKGWG